MDTRRSIIPHERVPVAEPALRNRATRVRDLVAPTLSVVRFSDGGLTALRSARQLTTRTAELTWANTHHSVVPGPRAPTVALVSASADRVQALMAMPLDELWALLVAPPVAVEVPVRACLETSAELPATAA